MRRFWLGLAVASALSACGGGNPFKTDDDTDTDTGSSTGTDTSTDTGSTVPASVAGDVVSVNYVASDDTLFITGIANDDVPYTRNAALDRTGSDGSVYQAYTYQEHSQAPHSTAYFREMEGGYAMVVATGNGPSGYYMSGTQFGSDDSFTAPADSDPTGAVSYAGTYIGLLNMAGSGEDLLPTDPGTHPSLIPSQVAEVTGDVFILADFGTDGAIDGRIYNRTVVDDPTTSVEDLELVPTSIGSDGTFEGTVEVGTDSVGDYAGIFTGAGATAVAGTVHATGHISAYGDDIVEYGAFVIGQCSSTSSHSDCPSDE